MDKQFQFDIITSQRTIYHGMVSTLVVPGESGCMGILANHAALITNIRPGKILFKEEPAGDFKSIDSPEKGFIEIKKNNVTVLLDNQ
ncbi:MAG: F0F1 ATP synthase subunit epsilon [Candidatus Omnitrophota bacterium]